MEPVRAAAAPTAVITGGSSGIGRAVSCELASRGWHIVVADIADGSDTVAAIRSAGGSAEYCELDVRDAPAFRALIEGVEARRGQVDLLMNNAGIGVGGPVEELTPEHWDRVIDVNLRGVSNGIWAVYPSMVARGSGHIVNTASLAGLIPSPLLTPYAATKHAVVGLSLSLRAEAAAKGVNVTVICPGFTETPILDSEGPEDLARTSLPPGGVRRMAEALPGGVHDVDLLAKDIVRAIEQNKPILVAPRSAQVAWWWMRLSPARTVRTIGLQTQGLIRKLASASSSTSRGKVLDSGHA